MRKPIYSKTTISSYNLNICSHLFLPSLHLTLVTPIRCQDFDCVTFVTFQLFNSPQSEYFTTSSTETFLMANDMISS
jgi:hypothetical protein